VTHFIESPFSLVYAAESVRRPEFLELAGILGPPFAVGVDLCGVLWACKVIRVAAADAER
jgi:hypothetical protein